MTKRRLKLKVILALAIIIGLIIGFLLIVIFPKKEEVTVKEKTISSKEQVEKIIKDQVDTAFIDWVDNQYEGSMSKMLKLLKENSYQETMWHQVTGYSYLVLQDLYQKKYDSMKNVTVLDSNTKTISVVGDVSLADNWHIMPHYDSKGINGILSNDVLEVMRNSDLMIANSEFTVSNRGTPMSGKLYTFRAKPERLKIYEEMGVDMVTLANNHVYDYGQDAFFDMLDAFDEYKIPRIGAGRNLEEAMKPYYYIVGGYKFAFVNATRAEKYIMTPGATETSEGVFRCYDPSLLIEEIKQLKQESDYVIAIIHYGKEGYHELEEEQISSSHQYIDAGADAVIGHHAHTLQGIEFYNHKPIIYNLGNFIFSHDTDDTAIFQIQLKEDGTMNYYMIPALQKNCYTDLLIDAGKQTVINDLNSWSINAHLTAEGEILEG